MALAWLHWMVGDQSDRVLPDPADENQVYSYAQLFTLGEVATMLWLTTIGARGSLRLERVSEPVS